MNNLKETAFYEVITTGLVVQLISVNGTIATCRYHGQTKTFILNTSDLRYLGDSYKPLKPTSINLRELIAKRNQEVFDFGQRKAKTKKKVDPQVELARLILETPPEKLEELLISRALLTPKTEEEKDA